MALIVEDGTALSNAESYISVADADTYFSSARGPSSNYASDWNAAGTTTKEAVLRWACRDVDYGFDFYGDRVKTTQALKWPRTNLDAIDGVDVASTSVPTAVKYAQLEQALQLLRDATRGDDQEVGVSQVVAGTSSVTFDVSDRPREVCRQARKLLQDYGTPRSSSRREVWRA